MVSSGSGRPFHTAADQPFRQTHDHGLKQKLKTTNNINITASVNTEQLLHIQQVYITQHKLTEITSLKTGSVS